MEIKKPVLFVDKDKALRNIERIKKKIWKSNHVIFRPHFKTHQSAQIGEWFRAQGVNAIAVSSVDMALYFAQNGWKDITIAILVNKLEIDSINRLTEMVDLNLLVDSTEVTAFLHQKVKKNVKVWIKIDTGYHRTGIEWNQKDEILSVAKEIKKSRKLHFKGLLTHSGHAYNPKPEKDVRIEGLTKEKFNKKAIKNIYNDTIEKMNKVRDHLKANGFPESEISIGDTPTCSLIDEFRDVDEVRCGNFVFYDVMQLSIGSCNEEDIAVALACPVIALYPQRKEIVIYGGAIHLSTTFITNKIGQKIFGLMALPHEGFQGWGKTKKKTYVSALSQEHGIIKTTDVFIKQVNVGDILMILPIHSCLTANLMKQYRTFDGEIIGMMWS